MLVLKMKHLDEVYLTGGITIRVFHEFGQVRLAFDAPKDVRILRSEIVKKQALRELETK